MLLVIKMLQIQMTMSHYFFPINFEKGFKGGETCAFCKTSDI